MDDTTSTYHKPVKRQVEFREPDLQSATFLEAFNVDNTNNDCFMQTTFNPVTMLKTFNANFIQLAFAHMKFPHFDKQYKDMRGYLTSIGYIALAQKIFRTCFRHSDTHQRLNWMNYLKFDLPAPMAHVIEQIGEMKTNYGKSKFTDPEGCILQCFLLAMTYAHRAKSDDSSYIPIEGLGDQGIDYAQISTFLEDTFAVKDPTQTLLSYVQDGAANQNKRKMSILKDIESMTRNQSHDVKDFKIQMLANTATTNLDHDVTALITNWKNQFNAKLNVQKTKYIEHIYDEDFKEAAEAAQVGDLTTVHGQVIEKSDKKEFKDSVKKWKSEYKHNAIKKEFEKMLKQKTDFNYDPNRVFVANPFTFATPDTLEHTKRYFCADLSILGSTIPTAAYDQNIAIVHCGLVPQHWEQTFRSDICNVVLYWAQKYQHYLSTFVQMTKNFSASDSGELTQLGGQHIQFPISNYDHVVGAAFRLGGRIHTIGSFTGRTPKSMDDLQHKLKNLDVQQALNY